MPGISEDITGSGSDCQSVSMPWIGEDHIASGTCRSVSVPGLNEDCTVSGLAILCPGTEG